MPEHLQPAVAEGPQGGVVALPTGTLGVVELTPPGRAADRAEGPLLDGVGQVAIAGQAVGDHQLALPGAAGDGSLSGIALQRVRRLELLEVAADLTSWRRGGSRARES
jgi:hypothetical protein